MDKTLEAVKRLTSVFILLVFVFFVGYVFAGEKAVIKEVGKLNGWRELKIVEPHGRFLGWCGSDKKMLVVDEKRHKRHYLIDIETRNVQKVDLNFSFGDAYCSSDGRYIFFIKMGDVKGNPINAVVYRFKNLHVYDLKTNKTSVIYSVDKPLFLKFLDKILSPMGKYLIGPANWKEQVQLPGGEDVKVVPFETLDTDKPIDESKFIDTLEWSPDDSKLFLAGEEGSTIFIRDPETNQVESINLMIKGFKINKIKASSNNMELYIGTAAHSGGDVGIYVMDLRNLSIIPKFLLKEIYNVDISSNGTVVFSNKKEKKTWFRTKKMWDCTIDLMNKNGQIQSIAQFSFYRDLVPVIAPKFSGDGKAIVFRKPFDDNREVMTVLIKDIKDNAR